MYRSMVRIIFICSLKGQHFVVLSSRCLKVGGFWWYGRLFLEEGRSEGDGSLLLLVVGCGLEEVVLGLFWTAHPDCDVAQQTA